MGFTVGDVGCQWADPYRICSGSNLFILLCYQSIQYSEDQMSSATLTFPTLIHFDAVSQASTDGDDNYQCPTLLPLSGQKKTCEKNKVKRSLCRNFSEKGYCPYGKKCQFAHGVEELRCNIDENAYKTKPCNSFLRKSYCPYGPRCNFSHSQQSEDPHKYQKSTQMLKSYREIIYSGKTIFGSRLNTILE